LEEVYASGGIRELAEEAEQGLDISLSGTLTFTRESFLSFAERMGSITLPLSQDLSGGETAFYAGTQQLNGVLLWELFGYPVRDGRVGLERLQSEAVALYAARLLSLSDTEAGEAVFRELISSAETDLSAADYLLFRDNLRFLNVMNEKRKLTYSLNPEKGELSKAIRKRIASLF